MLTSNKAMKRILVMAAAALASVSIEAKVWTLQECIQYAVDNNLTLKQSAISVEQREVELNTSRARRLPGVSASASDNFSFGRGMNADNTYKTGNNNVTSMASFGIGADMTLFQGFSIQNNIELSRLNLEAATADLEKAREDVSVQVAQAYVQILYDIEILSVAQNQVSVDSVQVERIQAMMQNGKASQAELSAQKAALAQSLLSETQARGNLNLAILDLTQLLELPSPEGFEVEQLDASAFEAGLLMNPEDIYAEAVGIKPSIRSEQIRLDYAERNIDVAKGNYLPSLSLNGGISGSYYSSAKESMSFADQLKENSSKYLGVSLSIPVFSRYQNRNGVRSAQLSFDNQQLQLESARKALYKEIQQAYYNAVASESKLESSKLAEQSAKEAFETMSAKYENGKAGITDYNESKARWIQAASDLAQARYQHLYQTRLLDFYRGAGIFGTPGE